jgi:site-specific DNA-methyltransferase (adenine-specific)
MNDECLADYKYYFSERFNLFKGDSRQVLPLMKDNSIDSVVCDPPYELGFMGKSWDSTGIANDPKLWKEVLRVLKPGGHLLAFSGSRTYHRMAVAIEDAGFEIRDQIMWVYGSGFPKSHNISKGIDKAAGAEREVVGTKMGGTPNTGLYEAGLGVNEGKYISETVPATADAKQWQGWGTALKPAHEPIVLARKPLEGTVANNVLTYGVGGINIDGTRVGTEGGTKLTVENNDKDLFAPGSGKLTRGYGEVVDGLGRFPANFIHDGSDEVVALFPDTKATGSGKVSGFRKGGASENSVGLAGKKNAADGFSDSGSAARFFYCAKASKRDRNEGCDEFQERQVVTFATANGTSGKPSSISEGRDTKNRNHHPTVKPTDLMQYLCRLITPPNGTILDPFLGSGSTGKAAMYEGFNFVGIELTQEYLPIAKARIEFALANLDEKLF